MESKPAEPATGGKDTTPHQRAQGEVLGLDGLSSAQQNLRALAGLHDCAVHTCGQCPSVAHMPWLRLQPIATLCVP